MGGPDVATGGAVRRDVERDSASPLTSPLFTALLTAPPVGRTLVRDQTTLGWPPSTKDASMFEVPIAFCAICTVCRPNLSKK